MTQDRMDDATIKAVEKIEKLMRLAGSNPNEAETSSALAKAQKLLIAYGLDMAVVEQMSGHTGKRVDEMVSGGMHKYQRTLWRHIAELNFCVYWTQKNKPSEAVLHARRHWKRVSNKFIHEHRLVGRTVNVTATKLMAQYLDAAINRLCEEKFLTNNYFKLTSRDAMAFREGIADRVLEKIAERRQDLELKEEREKAEAARKASASGVSLAKGLTIAGLSEKEEQGNHDFLHGEGAWARRKQRQAEWEAGWEERQVARAKALAAAEAEAAAWATAHPEEARAEAAKERKRERAAERRREQGGGHGRGRYRFRQTAEEMRRDSGSYHDGYAKGKEVSIDPQMDNDNRRRLK